MTVPSLPVADPSALSPLAERLALALIKPDPRAPLKRVRSALAAGADPNAQTRQGAGMLELAISVGRVDALEPLALAGARLDSAGSNGRTPMSACAKAPHQGGAEAMKELLRLGASPSGANQKGWPYVCEFAAAGSPDCVSALLSAGASPDDQDPEGWTALNYAAVNYDWEIALLLLEAGANPNNMAGSTALHEAAHCGSAEACEMMLKFGADPRAICANGETPLEWASRYHTAKEEQLIALLTAAEEKLELEGSTPAAPSVKGARL